MDEISFYIELNCSYEKALELVGEALKSEGFGILTEIDVKATLKTKIGADFRKYAILGACNPPLAHQALEADPIVGMLLPCNVTVEETDTGSAVNIVNPKAMLLHTPALAEVEQISTVANDAYERLGRVARTLEEYS